MTRCLKYLIANDGPCVLSEHIFVMSSMNLMTLLGWMEPFKPCVLQKATVCSMTWEPVNDVWP